MVGHLVYEIAVVRHYDHTPLECAQILLQNAERHDVQIVRRLVQNQEIGVAHQHRAEIQPPPFAAAEPRHEAVLRFGREEEVLQELRRAHAPSVAQVDLFGDFGHHVDHPLPLVELQPLLAVIAEADRLADLDRPAVRAFDPRQQFEERRFPAAVVAHDPQFLVAGEVVVEFVEEHQLAEPFADLLGFEYLGPDPRRLDVEPHFAAAARRLQARFQLVKGVDARPGLRRPRLRLAAHPLQLAAVEIRFALPPGRLRRLALLLLLQIIGVVARVVV